VQIVIGCIWLAAWLTLGSRLTAAKERDVYVRTVGSLLPAFSATSCAVFFSLNPIRGPANHALVLWLHHASVIALFAFLMAAQFLQLEAWWKQRRERSAASVASSYHRLWLLTELAPGAIAITILLSGLRLLWDSPDTTLISQPWLVIIIASTGVFFFDGLLGFTPIVRRRRVTWNAKSRNESTAGMQPTSAWEDTQIFAHSFAWPFLFFLGLYRFNAPNSASDFLMSVQHHLLFLPEGWRAVVLAAFIWALPGVVVVVLRVASRRL
jgi:uncharacterized membrane protein